MIETMDGTSGAALNVDDGDGMLGELKQLKL